MNRGRSETNGQDLPASGTYGRRRSCSDQAGCGAVLAICEGMIHHVTIAVRGRLALARDEAELRERVRAICRVGGPRLLLFSLADDHLHTANRSQHPGRVADSYHRVLRSRRPDLELKPPHLEPVATRSYLRWLVDYLVLQPARHGLPGHPALWTGSCFQDLVGARLLPGFDPAGLRAELPRLRLRDLFESLGLAPAPLEPAGDERLFRAGPARLVEAATAVHAASPRLQDRSLPTVQARALAVRLGLQVGFPSAVLARLLGVGPRAVRLLRAHEVDPRAILALRRRVDLEERVAQGAVALTRPA